VNPRPEQNNEKALTMNTITKRLSAFGVAGVAASALLVAGLAAPAQASEPDRTAHSSHSSAPTADLGLLNDALTGNTAGTGFSAMIGGGVLNAPLVNGPVVDRSLTSDIGDVASGQEVGNGTSVGNGNDVPVASGNDTSVTAPVTAPVGAPVGSGNDVTQSGANVSDIDIDIDSSVTDTVDNAVSGSLGGLDLGAILGR
jgi:hypothetical protein